MKPPQIMAGLEDEATERLREATRRAQAASGSLELSKFLAGEKEKKKKRGDWEATRRAADALAFIEAEAKAGRGERLLEFIRQKGEGSPEEKAASRMPEKLNIFEALTTDPAPLDFCLPGLLAGTVGALVSSGGLGKSWGSVENGRSNRPGH